MKYKGRFACIPVGVQGTLHAPQESVITSQALMSMVESNDCRVGLWVL